MLPGATGALWENGRRVVGTGPECRFIRDGRMTVRWDGCVSPCLSLMHNHTCFFRGMERRILCYHVGNIREQTLKTIWDSAEYRSFRDRVQRFAFAPCFDCGGCDLRESNERDCCGYEFPRYGECLWAAGLVQCL